MFNFVRRLARKRICCSRRRHGHRSISAPHKGVRTSCTSKALRGTVSPSDTEPEATLKRRFAQITAQVAETPR